MFEEIEDRRERLTKYQPCRSPDRATRSPRRSIRCSSTTRMHSKAARFPTATTLYIIDEDRLPAGRKAKDISRSGQQAALQIPAPSRSRKAELSGNLIREFHTLLTEKLPHENIAPGRYTKPRRWIDLTSISRM